VQKRMRIEDLAETLCIAFWSSVESVFSPGKAAPHRMFLAPAIIHKSAICLKRFRRACSEMIIGCVRTNAPREEMHEESADFRSSGVTMLLTASLVAADTNPRATRDGTSALTKIAGEGMIIRAPISIDGAERRHRLACYGLSGRAQVEEWAVAK